MKQIQKLDLNEMNTASPYELLLAQRTNDIVENLEAMNHNMRPFLPKDTEENALGMYHPAVEERCAKCNNPFQSHHIRNSPDNKRWYHTGCTPLKEVVDNPECLYCGLKRSTVSDFDLSCQANSKGTFHSFVSTNSPENNSKLAENIKKIFSEMMKTTTRQGMFNVVKGRISHFLIQAVQEERARLRIEVRKILYKENHEDIGAEAIADHAYENKFEAFRYGHTEALQEVLDLLK